MDYHHIRWRRQKNLIKSFPFAHPTECVVMALILVSLLEHMLQYLGPTSLFFYSYQVSLFHQTNIEQVPQ